MKKTFFAYLFYFITVTQASDNTPIQAGITIAQILATPHLSIFIGGPKQVAVWKELTNDLIKGMENFPNFKKELQEPTIHFFKLIIQSGFQPSNFEICQQSLIAIMFFIRSINKDLKTIQTFIINKSYPIGYFEPWKAMEDHLCFAKLIAKRKISCMKVNTTPIYHPINFDYEEVPTVVSKIARTYGPFFQDINLKDKLDNETHRSLIHYAHFERDPRVYGRNEELIFFDFPDARLNLDLK